MANVRRLIPLLLLGVGLSACAGLPPVATPQDIQAGANTNRAQQDVAAAIVCPTGTRRREFLEAETRVQSGRGGAPSTVVRVQCIPNDAQPGEIPPLARPADPPPAVAPLGRPGFVRPYGRGISDYERTYGVRDHIRGWSGGHRVHPNPGYAPNGIAPYWDGAEWRCTNPWSGTYRCLNQ